MSVSSPTERRVFRFSLRVLFLLITLSCVAAWWWQRPYRVETPQQLYAGHVDDKPTFSQGRRVESFRRQLFGDPVKHGPTRIYDEDGRMRFEDHWRNGQRHGLYRNWEQPSGVLIAELEFDEGKLVRFGETAVDDFMPDLSFRDPAGERIQAALQGETSFAYDDPIADVLDDIAFRHDIPIRLDRRAFEEAGRSPTTTVSSHERGIPLFAALCVALTPLDLTCAYRYEQLWITTPQSALFDDKTDVLAVAKEGQLGAKLAENTKFGYRDQSLQDVLDDISRRHQITIVNQVTNSPDVTMTLYGAPLHSALATLLYQLNLRCEVQGDTLVIQEVSK